MAAFTVFYAWQSDQLRAICRDFVRNAAEVAIARRAKGATLDDAPRLEHDTTGVAGVPSIGDTILRRIERCAIFLGDVTLVGDTTRTDRPKKKTPNPNVMLELGYAAGRIGWNRIILIMNTEFGMPEELPFDLRFRRQPYCYSIAADRSDIDGQSHKLAEYLEMAITTMEQEEHQAVADILKKLDGHSRHFLQKHSQYSHFWETEVGNNSIPGILDVVITRLLELGITECVLCTKDNGETGYAYTWTFLGKLCLRQLALSPPDTASTRFLDYQSSVVVDISAYDALTPITTQ